jgi:hypothetical protein
MISELDELNGGIQIGFHRLELFGDGSGRLLQKGCYDERASEVCSSFADLEDAEETITKYLYNLKNG